MILLTIALTVLSFLLGMRFGITKSSEYFGVVMGKYIQSPEDAVRLAQAFQDVENDLNKLR